MKLFLLSCGFMLFTLIGVSAQSPTGYQLSTHMLDVSKGAPATGVKITLYQLQNNGTWKQMASGVTNDNGRIADFLPDTRDNTGTYKLHFETEPYFKQQNLESIYPYVEIVFHIEGKGHYHIPITMSANGYATYRGN
ncbi:hydroxyisourate hydrolase [Bacteroides sp.]